MTKNAIFVLSGNCRTFIDCFDSLYLHIISKIFSSDFNIYLYLYLKITDPGAKGQEGWDFEYKDIDYHVVIDNINKIKKTYSSLNIDYKIISSNEISDHELLSQVKDRTLYEGFYSENNKLLRGLHCHYNFECCGKYILEKEKSIQNIFDYVIYVRPDLFFQDSCDEIGTYNKHVITVGSGPNAYNNDHIAIIPRNHFDRFFFDRIEVYRNNTVNHFITPEEVYLHTIKYEEKSIGKYYIKRT